MRYLRLLLCVMEKGPVQNHRKIIHIDIDPSSISKRVKVDIPIVGSVSKVLNELIKLIKASKEKTTACEQR